MKALRRLTHGRDRERQPCVRVPEVYLGFSRGEDGYIAMDFVQGVRIAQRKAPKGNYYEEDIEVVVAVVQQLVDIEMPAGTAPDPVISLGCFVEYLSAFKYPCTVGHLVAQMNRVCCPLAFGTLH